MPSADEKKNENALFAPFWVLYAKPTDEKDEANMSMSTRSSTLDWCDSKGMKSQVQVSIPVMVNSKSIDVGEELLLYIQSKEQGPKKQRVS